MVYGDACALHEFLSQLLYILSVIIVGEGTSTTSVHDHETVFLRSPGCRIQNEHVNLL
jgi:hypothetical protein